MAWQEPKTDWKTNPKNPKSEDFNRIEGNILALKEEIETKKGEVVTALNSVGVNTVLGTDTHAQIASKIVAAKKTNIILTPSVSDVAIPKGIFDVDGGKVAGDPDLVPANIVENKDIFGVKGVAKLPTGNAVAGDVLKGKTFSNASAVGVTGTLELTGDATTSQVLSGRTFYTTNPNSKLSGAMANHGAKVFTPSMGNQSLGAGYVSSLMVEAIKAMPGDNNYAANWVEVSTGQNTPKKFKWFTVNLGGILRVVFDLKSGNTSDFGNGRVAKNGNFVGTLRQIKGTAYTTFTEDIAVSVGDEIALYIWATTSGFGAYNNKFEVKGIFPVPTTTITHTY